jgi:hypothetical protein
LITLPLGVGHAEDEESLSLLRGADFRRRKEARRNTIAHLLKLSDDRVCSKRQMAGDVLEEDDAGGDFSHDSGDVGPEVSRVIDPTSRARH